jgi:hypothetical protein
MSSPKPTQGVKSARNPSSVAQEEHHDPTAAGKSSYGILASIRKVVATSTTAEPVEDNAVLWVVNRSASAQFIRTGKMSDLSGAVDATNGLCLPPGFATHVFCPESDDPIQAVGVKTSHVDVHVTVLES